MCVHLYVHNAYVLIDVTMYIYVDSEECLRIHTHIRVCPGIVLIISTQSKYYSLPLYSQRSRDSVTTWKLPRFTQLAEYT